jgi:hypothetical protein
MRWLGDSSAPENTTTVCILLYGEPRWSCGMPVKRWWESMSKAVRGKSGKFTKASPSSNSSVATSNFTPAIYDPQHYPEEAKVADAHLKAHPPTPPEGYRVVPIRPAQTIGEVFAVLKDCAPADRVMWLHRNDSLALRYLLRLGLEESVEWLIPKGLPPYTPFAVRRGGRAVKLRAGMAATELKIEARRLYIFIKGDTAGMTQLRREKVFQQIIEDMDSVEVDVLASIKDKRLDKFVSRETILAAFPNLLVAPFNSRFLRR